MTQRFRVTFVLLGSLVGHVLLAQAPENVPAAPPTAGRGGAGRGAGRGNAGGAAGAPQQRRTGFTQFTRPLASQDVIARGKSLYEATCASCHLTDLRGGANGPNLLRSANTLNDKAGELVGAAVAKHNPAIHLVETDTVAIAEYIHSVLATAGGQGSPPGRNPMGVQYNILVGDAKAGEAYFAKSCASCHSITGDLKGIGATYSDPRTLQNAWVAGSSGVGGGGGGGGRGAANAGYPAVVTMADGSKLEGKLVRKDDFIVILTLADGTRKSIARNNDLPKVEIKDPNEAHKKMALELDDPENKNMHDVTAYLATLK